METFMITDNIFHRFFCFSCRMKLGRTFCSDHLTSSYYTHSHTIPPITFFEKWHMWFYYINIQQVPVLCKVGLSLYHHVLFLNTPKHNEFLLFLMTCHFLNACSWWKHFYQILILLLVYLESASWLFTSHIIDSSFVIHSSTNIFGTTELDKRPFSVQR